MVGRPTVGGSAGQGMELCTAKYSSWRRNVLRRDVFNFLFDLIVILSETDFRVQRFHRWIT